MSKSHNFCIVCFKHNKLYEGNPLRSLYSFPKSPDILEKWLTILNLKDTKITKRGKVCELHFSKSQFVRTRLIQGAIPSLTPRVKSVTGSSGTASSSNKSIKPSHKNLIPVLLLTQAAPLPVFQVTPTSSQTTVSSLPSISQPQVQDQSDTCDPLKDKPAMRTTDTFEPIPGSLKKLLQESLKKEIADKVLKDAPSVKNFCEKIIAEMENWSKSHEENGEELRKPTGSNQFLETIQPQPIVEKEEATNEDEEECPLPLSFYPTVSVKVEDGYHQPPHEVEPEDDNYVGDPLGDDENDEDDQNNKPSVRIGQEFMEWHDESDI